MLFKLGLLDVSKEFHPTYHDTNNDVGYCGEDERRCVMLYHSMKEEHNLFMCVRISSSTLPWKPRNIFYGRTKSTPLKFLSTLIY